MENLRTVYTGLIKSHEEHIQQAKEKKKKGIDHENHIDSAASIAQELDMYVMEFTKLSKQLQAKYVKHAPIVCYTFKAGLEKDVIFYEKPELEDPVYTFL